MPKRRHTPEQVSNKLREAEVATAEGSTVAEAARRIGVDREAFPLRVAVHGRAIEAEAILVPVHQARRGRSGSALTRTRCAPTFKNRP